MIGGSSRRSLGGMCYWGVPILSISDDTASRAGFYNGDGGRVTDPLHGSEVREHLRGKTTRRYKPGRESKGQNAHRARFFGDLGVEFDVKTSRRHYGAERTDPRRRSLHASGGAPQRRIRTERRSEAGEIRRPKDD